MRPLSLFSVAMAVISSLSCSSELPTETAIVSTSAGFDLITTVSYVKISDDEFMEADANGNGRVCAKETPSGGIVLKDDNQNTPSQPCPPAFSSHGKGEAVEIIVEKWEEDLNRNGVVCIKYTPQGNRIIKDDNPQTPSQPCPSSFNLAGNPAGTSPTVDYDDLVTADENGNGLVCLKENPNGNFTVKDDNTSTPSQPCPAGFGVVTVKTEQPPPKMEG